MKSPAAFANHVSVFVVFAFSHPKITAIIDEVYNFDKVSA